MKDMKAITLTTLKIINDRIFPHSARKHDDWNQEVGVGLDFILLSKPAIDVILCSNNNNIIKSYINK